MSKGIAVGCLVFMALGSAMAQGADPADVLIKQLGSANSTFREAATKALLARPESEPALREAVRSKDLEISRRASSILAEFERRRSPFRQLDEDIETGRVERAIELIAAWPGGKNDDVLWERVQMLTLALIERGNKGEKREDGKDGRFVPYCAPRMPTASVATKRFCETTQVPGFRSGWLFARASEVDYDKSRLEKGQIRLLSPGGASILSAGKARLAGIYGAPIVVLACGPVELYHTRMGCCVVVSCEDVVLDGVDLNSSLIIAKGTVDARNACTFSGCRIIAGKSVRCDGKKQMLRTEVIENEPSPLGYIQWGNQLGGENKEPKGGGGATKK